MSAQMSQQARMVLDALPLVRGKYLPDYRLADVCWFRVGGLADVVYMPADRQDLAAFLAGVPSDMPLHILGAGSNTLVRDAGVRGVVIRLGSAFGSIEKVADGRLEAGASALDVRVARAAAAADLSGLEFLSGIPGAIGGALAMNAGAYGGEISDVLVSVDALDRQGRVLRLAPSDFDFAYRHNGYGDFIVYLSAQLQAVAGDAGRIEARMREIAARRTESQPIKSRTGGSTFKNPEKKVLVDSQGLKAWELIDAAGGRGLRQGDAQISDLHCNFLINHGAATAADLENLGERVRRLVYADSGTCLAWEIRRIGEVANG